jgi:hypothetical protein
VSIAVLTSGAALDAAARDRFVTAIRQAQQGRGGIRGLMDRVRGRAVFEALPVLAMRDGEAPWVAVPFLPGGPGAERFLDPVMVSGTLIGRRQGPDFVHYWLGDRTPALPAPPPPPPPPVATRRSVVLASTLLTTLLVMLVVMLWLILFRGGDDQLTPRPLPATNFVPTPPPVPTPGGSGQPSPTPSDGRQTPSTEDPDDGRGPI